MAPRNFWLKQGFIFYPAEDLFAYGLKTPNNGTKGFLMCIQAHLLRQLLFEGKQQKGKPG